MAERTSTMAGGEKERIGRLLAALGVGAEVLNDAELDALRKDLERLREDADFEAHARAEARRYEIEEARRAERERPRARRRLAREAERKKLPVSARKWAAHQYRKCGKQGKCKVCGAGPGHGPYWYLFYRGAPGAALESDYIGRCLNAEGSEALAVVQLRRDASARRSKIVSDIIAGKHDDALGLPEPFDLREGLDETCPGWRELVRRVSERLLGLTPEEVFPDDFEPEAVEKAREKRLRKKRKDQERTTDEAASSALERGYSLRSGWAEKEAEPTA